MFAVRAIRMLGAATVLLLPPSRPDRPPDAGATPLRAGPRFGRELTAPGRPVSAWLDGEAPPPRPALAGEGEADVVVLGAGIVGLTTALEAQRDGARVAVLEARTVGAGVSGNTTAKLSALHGMAYESLASAHGPETAAAYAEANLWGVERVAELASEHGIDCDLRRKPNFTYTEDPEQLDALRAEADAASAAGLEVGFTGETDLPFEVAGAIRCEGQAEFHPVKYLRGLADAFEAAGGKLFEGTRATGAAGDKVRTADGARLDAGRVVMATHAPFTDRSLVFARAEVERSYAISVRLRGQLPQGMYLQAEKPGRSLRAIPWDGEELLMVGGQSHPLGQGDAAESFEALERYARGRFEVAGVEHRWDAHDFMPADGLPFVGPAFPGSEGLLMASGMRKWGLAMGTAAGRMLADRIAGRENDWAPSFDPWRVPRPSSLGTLLKHNAESGLHFFADRLTTAGGSADLGPGEGRVVRDGLALKAVHRDEGGTLRAVSARCTHLGCIVRWNGPQRTWDCPCHGSRFEAGGEVANGPATAPLRPVDPPSS